MAKNPLRNLFKNLPATVIAQAEKAAIAAARIVVEESRGSGSPRQTAKAVADRFKQEARGASKRAATRTRQKMIEWLERQEDQPEPEYTEPPEIARDIVTARPATQWEREELVTSQMELVDVPEDVIEIYEEMDYDEMYEIEGETTIKPESPDKTQK